MKRLAIFLSALFLSVAMAGPAFAANPHYVSGPNFSLEENTVTATGSIAGLGNQNIDVELIVDASLTVQCRNPGGNIAPGQTKFFTASAVQSNVEVKNGRVNFTISATADPAGVDLTGACPNPRWTPLPDEVTVLNATLNIYQPSGSEILVLSDSHAF